VCDGLTHHDINDCLRGFIGKLRDTGKQASKYYVLFHAIPLILRLRRVKGLKPAINNIVNAFYDYVKSLCFMAFLVALLRGAMCFVNHSAPNPNLCNHALILEISLIPGCLLSGGSVLFENGSRRKEIGYFVCSKALRSCYIGAKRVFGLNL